MNFEMNQFYNMDCMEAMKQIPDKYFELAIVDPPYGIGIDEKMSKQNGKKYGGKTLAKRGIYKKTNWDIEPPNEQYFEELIRISNNQIIWGANHFISKIPFDSSCWVVWDKHTNGAFADCELAYTSFKSAVRKFDFMWNGMLQENMKNKEIRFHPTQKPVALYKWLLTNYAKQGDKILDTHVGSASSLIACYDLGFDYMGFELDKDYYDMATKRLDEHKKQLNLFVDFGL